MTSLPITYAEDEPAMTNDPDSVHPSAADAVAVSGSDVPARPTSLAAWMNAILNLPCNELYAGTPNREAQAAYGKGFRRACEDAAELLRTSPPLPLEQGARMLTTAETDSIAEACEDWIGFDVAEAVIVKFCEVNGIALAPPVADPGQAQMGETK